MIHILINFCYEGLGICQEFTLNSNGITRHLYPGIIGDYLLQSERNNGRAVYRSKGKVIIDQLREYIYLYSFNDDEYAGDAGEDAPGTWLVSFMKASTFMRRVMIVPFQNMLLYLSYKMFF